MTGNEVNLTQMLERREARAHEQRLFLEKYGESIISFSMNIPGPIKTNQAIKKAFEAGKNLLLGKLEGIGARINQSVETHEDTGDELLLSVGNAETQKLKDLAVSIENESELGRLYDIDVIDPRGNKLSREGFRKCLICGRQAQECARSRTHSVKEMQDAIDEMLNRYMTM